MRTPLVGLVAVVVIIAAACGGGGAAEDESTTDDSPSGEAVASTTTADTAAEQPEDSAGSSSQGEDVPAVPLSNLIPAINALGPRGADEIPTQLPEPMCPGWDQMEGLSPTETATRTFAGDLNLGPYMTIGLFDFPSGEADAYLDAHIEGAAGPCAQYDTFAAQGGSLSLGWSEVAADDYGDRSVTLEVRGDASGVPVNSDVVLVRVGDRVGYVGYLSYGVLPDAATRDAAVAGVVEALNGVNVGTIHPGGSGAEIAAALPGLDALANPELVSERSSAMLPDGQCPGNLTTLQGLSLKGAGARDFLGSAQQGPFVMVSILEFNPGEADEFIDRWVAGASGPCVEYTASGLDWGWSVGSGPEYLDRTVTLFGRGHHLGLDAPASADYVLIRSGDFVAYIHYFVTRAETPDSSTRDTMVAALAEALEQVST